MKIILFGSTGMLGNYVNKYLLSKYEIHCINRNHFDIESCDWSKMYSLLDSIVENKDIIINCAGAIPQRWECNRYFIVLNTLFPIKLNDYAKRKNIKFIHITTDCVFSGNDGNYIETSNHDSKTNYGITKSLGEEQDMCIIRTSIIGEEINNKNSLIEWVKKNKDCIIEGYEHYLWNGVTCLQLSKIIEAIIKHNNYWQGVRHVFSPDTVSKYQLCFFINEIYNLDIEIIKKDNPTKNMTLSTIYTNDNILLDIPDIKTQITEQYEYGI